MKFANLINYKNAQMIINERNFAVARPKLATTHEAVIAVSFGDMGKAGAVLGEKFLTVSKSGAGDAVWIPYLPKISVYGYLDGGQSVAVSGPFSGCYFEVGKHGGRVYAAHVSCEGKGDENVVEWLAGNGLADRTVLFRKKIGMAAALPDGATNAAAIVFAQIEGNNVTVTRVDVMTQSAGGMSGPIFGVSDLISDPIA